MLTYPLTDIISTHIKLFVDCLEMFTWMTFMTAFYYSLFWSIVLLFYLIFTKTWFVSLHVSSLWCYYLEFQKSQYLFFRIFVLFYDADSIPISNLVLGLWSFLVIRIEFGLKFWNQNKKLFDLWAIFENLLLPLT